MTKPIVSIIIRNHNNRLTLHRAICSALGVFTPNFKLEVIVVDDHSTDSSHLILSQLKNYIRIVHADQSGHVHALNYGTNHCQGKYFFILDADDVVPPLALAKLMAIANSQSRIAAVYGDYYECIEKSAYSCYYRIGNDLLSTIAGGILFNKQLVVKSGLYDESLFLPEYDLLLTLAKKFRVKYLPEVSYCYMRYATSLTHDQAKVAEGIAQLRKKHGPELQIRRY